MKIKNTIILTVLIGLTISVILFIFNTENLTSSDPIQLTNKIEKQFTKNNPTAHHYYKTLLKNIELNKFDSIPFLIEKSIELAQESKDNRLLFKIHKAVGYHYLYTSELAKSLESFQNALYYQPNLDTKEIGDIYLGIGGIYFYLDDFKQSLDYCELAHDVYKKANSPRSLSSYHANIANIYAAQNQTQKAIKSLEKSLLIAEKHKDTLVGASILNSLSILAIQQEDYKAAKEYITKAYKLTEKNKDSQSEANILHTKGLLFETLEEFDTAVHYFNQANAVITKDSLRIKLNTSQSLANIAESNNNYKLSNHYLKENHRIAEKIKGANVSKEIEKIKWQTILKEQTLKQTLTEQNLKFKTYLYGILTLLAFVSISLIWFMYKNKSNLLQLYKLEKESLEESFKIEKELKISQEIIHKQELNSLNKELASLNILMLTRNDFLNELNKIISTKEEIETSDTKLKKIKRAINNTSNIEKDWGQFQQIFQQIHPGFFSQLQERYPHITKSELRICAYIKINMANNEIASLLNISHKSLITSRYRIRKKLNLESSDNLDELIQSF